MRLDQWSGVESLDPPTIVLLIGEGWHEVQLVLTSLASQGAFVFRSPSTQQAGSLFDDTDPSVIMIGTGTDYYNALGSTNYANNQVICPPVLACVTHENLENTDVFENADDFLVVPCSSAEMGKRIKRLALRGKPLASSAQLTIGKIALDLANYQVTVGGNRVDFAWLEFQLLKFLMENVCKVFSRQQLLTNVWGVDSVGGTRTVDVHIKRLRNKIEVQGDTYFRTVKNVGYGMTYPAYSRFDSL